jgi:hypothetical protein
MIPPAIGEPAHRTYTEAELLAALGVSDTAVTVPTLNKHIFSRDVLVRTAVPYWAPPVSPPHTEDLSVPVSPMEYLPDIFAKFRSGINDVDLKHVMPGDLEGVFDYTEFNKVVDSTLKHPYTPIQANVARDLKRNLNTPFITALNACISRNRGKIKRVLIVGAHEGDDFKRLRKAFEYSGQQVNDVAVYAIEPSAEFSSALQLARNSNGFARGMTYNCTMEQFAAAAISQKGDELPFPLMGATDHDWRQGRGSIPRFDLVLCHFTVPHLVKTTESIQTWHSFLNQRLEGDVIGCFMDPLGASLLSDPIAEHTSDHIRVLQYHQAISGRWEWGGYTVAVGNRLWFDPIVHLPSITDGALQYGLVADVFPGKEVKSYLGAEPPAFLKGSLNATENRAVVMYVVSRGKSRLPGVFTAAVKRRWRWVGNTSNKVPPVYNKGRCLDRSDIPYLRSGDYLVSEKLDGWLATLEIRPSAKPRFIFGTAVYELDESGNFNDNLVATLQVELVGPLPVNVDGATWVGELWATDVPMAMHPGLVSFRSRWGYAASTLSSYIAGIGFKKWKVATPSTVSEFYSKSSEGIVFQSAGARPGVFSHGFGSARYLKKHPTVDLKVFNNTVHLPGFRKMDTDGQYSFVPDQWLAFHGENLGDGIYEFKVVYPSSINLSDTPRPRPDKELPNTIVQIENVFNSLVCFQVIDILQLNVLNDRTIHVSRFPHLMRAICSGGATVESLDAIESEAMELGLSYCCRIAFEPRHTPEQRASLLEMRFRWYQKIVHDPSKFDIGAIFGEEVCINPF